IMGEPLSPDRVFDFPVDEPEPHPAYDFFAPGLLRGYAVDEIAKPIVEAEEQVIALVVDMDEVDEIAEPIVEAEDQVIALVVDVDEDISMLFGDDDFKDDDSKGFNEEDVWEVNEGGALTERLRARISIGEIGLRVLAVEGQVQVMAS
nr:hypothetical protein [Tanacetum cinerariifolium]